MRCASFSYFPDPTSRMCELLRFGQITLAPPQCLLRPDALGDVADGSGDKRTLFRFQRTQTNFHGKLCAVFPPPVQLQTFTHRPYPRVCEELLPVPGV